MVTTDDDIGAVIGGYAEEFCRMTQTPYAMRKCGDAFSYHLECYAKALKENSADAAKKHRGEMEVLMLKSYHAVVRT